MSYADDIVLLTEDEEHNRKIRKIFREKRAKVKHKQNKDKM